MWYYKVLKLLIVLILLVILNQTLLVVIHEYGHLFIWNVLFWMDWHITYNFQALNIFQIWLDSQHLWYYTYTKIELTTFQNLLLDFAWIFSEFIFYILIIILFKKYISSNKDTYNADILEIWIYCIYCYMIISLLYNIILPIHNDWILLRSLLF